MGVAGGSLRIVPRMAGFVYFTDEQKQWANEVDLEDFLSRRGEKQAGCRKEQVGVPERIHVLQQECRIDVALFCGGLQVHGGSFPEKLRSEDVHRAAGGSPFHIDRKRRRRLLEKNQGAG